MKIAILGTRGIPNRYGGFEAFAEHLSRQLAERGHQVTVYCRRAFTRPGDEKLIDARVRRVILPGLPSKHLDTPVHTLLSALHVSFTRNQAIIMCNVGNAPFAWVPRLFGKPVILNVDGLDRKRGKWGWFASQVLHLCEWLSVYTPSRVVTDSRSGQAYYRERYCKASTMIGYGAEAPQLPPRSEGPVLARFNLRPRQYLLYVSRLEPENNPELVIQASKLAQAEWPLVVVGDNRYSPGYEKRLRAMANERVIFTGAVYGEGYWELQRNAGAFIFACEIGGIHPALVETMAAGNACLYLDTESNRETAGECGVVFSRTPEDLAAKIRQVVADPALRARLGAAAAERAQRLYSWAAITAQYEALLNELCPTREQ